ncbi:MAG: 23S rRNA (adenine(2503)-C(2))-methyltransferase RlmN [Candidatus Sumerlaeia bacterium]
MTSERADQHRSILELTAEELTEEVVAAGFEPWRVKQIRHWLYERAAESFAEMHNVPRALRARLEERFVISPLSLVRTSGAPDGTQKFLFSLGDGSLIESVLMPGEPHWSVCVSSQVGCALDCRFCATATMGFRRNLTAAEILAQALFARRVLQREGGGLLTHLVFMGMGEPLVNFRNLQRALVELTAGDGLDMSPRRITVSTAGYVPGIRRLAESPLDVSLAVSLNAPSQALRQRIMPAVARKYPLSELIAACRAYPLPRRRRITFEYVLLDGVNTGEQHAVGLARLLRGIRCKVNLIPFNEHPALSYRRPALETINRFGAILRDHNFTVTVRWSRGADIRAACGQLAAGQ